MKKITLLNACPDTSYTAFESRLTQAIDLRKGDLACDYFTLRDLKINACTGCFSCWVKTPGVCVFSDAMPSILRSMMQSDLVLFVSPVSMDFITALCKKCCDRMIPLVHPYIEVYKGEFHHINRYKRYPSLGLLLLDKDKDKTRFDIIREIFFRLSINLKTDLAVADMIDMRNEEVQDVVSAY